MPITAVVRTLTPLVFDQTHARMAMFLQRTTTIPMPTIARASPNGPIARCTTPHAMDEIDMDSLGQRFGLTPTVTPGTTTVTTLLNALLVAPRDGEWSPSYQILGNIGGIKRPFSRHDLVQAITRPIRATPTANVDTDWTWWLSRTALFALPLIHRDRTLTGARFDHTDTTLNDTPILPVWRMPHVADSAHKTLNDLQSLNEDLALASSAIGPGFAFAPARIAHQDTP